MTRKRYQQIKDLFDAALACPEGERASFVAEACGADSELREQVRRLLEAHQETVTSTSRSSPVLRYLDTGAPSREGCLLGGYHLSRLLGRGGMGNVYLARRSDRTFQKEVAVKILRADVASPEVVQRFQMEREILAALEHPNIARLLDAGQTEDGLPYFVMEYVEGEPITEYADRARLTTGERLALFRQVCDAVEYAHQRSIIHRDLKPANVLVTVEGQVKLLDFGIARLAEPKPGSPMLTMTGAWLMTPEYASPEQVRGESVGRETDIYSLGVMLFELLTSQRPYPLRSRIFHEVVRVVCEQQPTRPSVAITQPVETPTARGEESRLPPESTAGLRQTSLNDLRNQLEGDLDNIALKALEKQPRDRYTSVRQFSADLERHQKGEPVWARRNSWRYRAAKALSRYRFAAIATAAITAAMISGSVAVRWTAIWWIIGGAVFLALWRLATDPIAGQKLARSGLLSNRLVVLGFSMLVTVLIMIVGKRLSWPVALAQVAFVLLTIPTIYSVGFWFFRERWGGPVLLDLGTEFRPILVLAFVIGMFQFVNVRNLLPPGRGLAYILWYGAAWSAHLCLNLTYNVFKPREIRRDGLIVKQGLFIPWSRIRSWNWEMKDPGSDWPFLPSRTLVLHIDRVVQFLPAIRVEVSGGDVEAVAGLLRAQLGEWPS